MGRYGPYHAGPLRPTASGAFSGTVLGDLVAAKGMHVELTGIVTGRLIVEPGGSAIVWGEVWRGVINKGGEADVFGSISFSGTAEEKRSSSHVPSGMRF